MVGPQPVTTLFILLIFLHSGGLSHAASTELSPHPCQEEQWLLPTGTIHAYTSDLHRRNYYDIQAMPQHMYFTLCIVS